VLTYVYFGTNDLDKATAFYDATLAPLGMRRCNTNDPEWDRISAGWGIYEEGGGRELAFWIGKPFDQQPASAGNGNMVAFSGPSWMTSMPPLWQMAARARGHLGCGLITVRTFTQPTFAIPMAIKWPLCAADARLSDRSSTTPSRRIEDRKPCRVPGRRPEPSYLRG
jgi:hypothetical protein